MDTRTPPKILEFIMMVIMAPVLGPLIAGLWLHDQYRRHFPRPSDHWHRWFAWRPVRVWTPDVDASVWLETIERRRFYGSMDYRLPAAADRRITTSQ